MHFRDKKGPLAPWHGLAACCALAFALACAGCAKGEYIDGTYQGESEGVHGAIKVEVSVKGGKIAKVAIVNQEESSGVASVALQRIPQEIVKAQKTDVEVVSGASSSSKAIMEATAKALATAHRAQ